MKTWTLEIEIMTDDEVTVAEMTAVTEKIGDDAAMRVGDEIAGDTQVQLGELSLTL